MPDPDSSAASGNRAFWHRRAAQLAWKLNLHHWLAKFIPKLFIVLIFQTVFELLRREMGGPARWSTALLLFGIALAAGMAYLRARKHFCTSSQGLLRLETVLKLHNRLSAAEAGVVPWPAPPEEIDDGYVGNARMAWPVLAGVACLLAAHLVPVNHLKIGFNTDPISEPPEFAQVQSWINALKEENIIEPEKLAEMQTALDKLRDQPAQDWYKQSDLEAANSLKELMAHSMNSLSKDLDAASQAVHSMQQKAEDGPESANGQRSLQPMQDDLRKAMENLASGTLPLNKEMLGQLSGAEIAGEKTLNAEQLKDLNDRLKKGALAAKTAAKSNGGMSDEMLAAMEEAGYGEAGGKGTRKGKGGRHVSMPGAGGEGGGEETAPLELQARDKNTGAGPLTAVKNDDMSRSAVGESLKVSSSEHDVNPADYKGTQSAGAAQAQGNGGEAVWRSTYDPQEADTLQRFFK